MIGIYKIQNKINGKVYVGQSNDMARRWREHINSCKNENQKRNYNMIIHKAMRKYGIDNFSFEVLEECDIERLDEREQYWIAYLDSMNREKGYNLVSGGQSNMALSGENHSQAKLTQKEVDQIKSMLKADMSTTEILEKIGNKISRGMILNINQGRNWFDPQEDYPLRKIIITGAPGESNGRALLTEERVMEIRMMYSEGMAPKEIYRYAEEAWGVKPRTSRAALYGESWKCLPIWDHNKQEWI